MTYHLKTKGSSFFVQLRNGSICVIYYRPQRSWGKVIFSQAAVILFTGRGEVCLSACWDTSPRPSKAAPPPGRADPTSKVHPPAQCMLGDTVNKRAVCILLECNSCLPELEIEYRWYSNQKYLCTATKISVFSWGR